MRSTHAGGRTFHLGAIVTDELKLIAGIERLDAKILAARIQLDRIPGDLARLDAELQRRQGALADIKARRDANLKSRRALELEAEEHGSGIKRHQGQLAQVKTNKEYTAMLHEIEAAKAAVSQLEEKILLGMEEADALAAAEQAAQREFATESARIGQQRRTLEEQQRDVQSQVDALAAERQRAVGALPGDVLAAYQRIFQGRGGQAIVPVEHQACGGCGGPLPPQLVNEVRKMESIITCETCGRILIWNQEQTGNSA